MDYGSPAYTVCLVLLQDSTCLVKLMFKIRPDEVYNLAAMSHVKVSFDMAEYTGDIDGLGTLRLLDAIRTVGLEKTCKFYQASTSELYGKVQEVPQTEKTPFYPRSPYGVAKLYAVSVWALPPPVLIVSRHGWCSRVLVRPRWRGGGCDVVRVCVGG